MAKTVAIAFPQSTVTVNNTAYGQITVTNGDANPIGITGVKAYVSGNSGNSPAAVIVVPVAGGAGGAATAPTIGTSIVNGGGATLVFPVQFVAYAPALLGASNITYTVQADVTLADSTTVSNTTTVTVRPPA